MRHEVLISRSDGFPAVAAFVGGGEVEHGQEPGFPVGAVVGEGFAGPFAGDQDAAARVAEVLAAVGLALARTRPEALAGVFGLDSVASQFAQAGEQGSYRSASISWSAWSAWSWLSAWWQPEMCLVRYFVRYLMHRPESFDPASTPWASNFGPNLATCRGTSSGPMESRASSQLGRTSPVPGSR